MKTILIKIVGVITVLFLVACNSVSNTSEVKSTARKVSDQLTQDQATLRKGRVSNIAYTLDIDLISDPEAYMGTVNISFDLETNDRERVVALYDGGIRYADNQLAHLFRLAEELDLYRDTVFVFFSDHGEEFWDHGTTIHSHSLYQEQLHVPLILRTPKRDSKRTSSSYPITEKALAKITL